MTERVASILAEIGLDASKFTSGANTIGGLTSKLIDGIAGLSPVVGIAVGALAALFSKAKEFEQVAAESAKEGAKVEAVLQSTKYAAGITKDELDELAQTVSKSAGIDDELVQSAEAVLLTFTKVNKDVFPETITIAQDMAAILGGDLNSTIVQVGKAMNDFSGYTALKRAGVSFSEEQIEQIQHFKDTNDIIGYQNLLLKELQTEFGGAAKKVNDAGDGSENLKIAVDNLKEAIGDRLIPVQREWNKELTESINLLLNTPQQNSINFLKKLGDEYTSGTKTVEEYYQAAIEGGIESGDMYSFQEKKWVDYLSTGGKVADLTGLQAIQFDYLVSKYKLLTPENYKYLQSIEGGIPKFKELTQSQQAWADSLTAQGEAYKALHPQVVQTDEELQALSEKYQNILSLTSSLQSETDKYTNSMDDLHKKQADAKADLDKAIAGYWAYDEEGTKVYNSLQSVNGQLKKLSGNSEESQAKISDLTKKQAELREELDKHDLVWGQDKKGIEDAQKAYDDITKQISDLEEEHKKATNTIVYNNLLQKLSVDGLTDSEFAMAQQTGVALGLFTQATADSGVAINDLTTLLANGQITQEEFNLVVNSGTDAIHAFIDSINAIPEYKTTTITTIYTSAGGDVTYSAGGSGLVHAYQARATGGLADGTTLVGENGPELVDLPGGSMVYNANTTNQLLNNNDSVTYEQMRTLFNQQTQLLPILLANAIEKVVR